MSRAPLLVRTGPAQAAVLAALHAEAFPPHDAWPAEGLAKLLPAPGVAGRLALDSAGRPQGFVLWRVAADEAEILTLAVRPQARRQGIARALMAQAAAEAGSAGAVRLFLEVSVENAGARALYAAQGFSETGRRPAYFPQPGGPPVDALVLSLELGKRPYPV